VVAIRIFRLARFFHLVSAGVAVAPILPTAAVVEDMNRNIVRGLQPAGQNWLIHELEATASANGRIKVGGKGFDFWLAGITSEVRGWDLPGNFAPLSCFEPIRNAVATVGVGFLRGAKLRIPPDAVPVLVSEEFRKGRAFLPACCPVGTPRQRRVGLLRETDASASNVSDKRPVAIRR
jgi:hypothetical protein